MSLLKQTKTLCKEYSIMPLRRRGQSFLISPYIIKKLITIADLKKNDIVLEIGAGFGTLTMQIAKSVKKVIAVEIDKKFVRVLKGQLQDYKNVEVIQEDIRKFEISDIRSKHYKIVANLPFNITGLVLKRFLSEKPKPRLMVLIVQKQVGQRILAKPPKMSVLSLSVQFYAQAKIVNNINRNNFWPQPNVDSVIIKIIPHTHRIRKEKEFFQIVKAGFSSPRKYLINNLINYGMITKDQGVKIFQNIELNTKARAQELSVKQWIKLVYNLQ